MSLDLGSLLLAMAVTSVFLPFTNTWLSRRGIVDLPNGRSLHTAPTPRGAGVALAIGVAATWPLAGIPGVAVFGFVIIMSFLGFMDDLRSRTVLLRLGIQVVLAFAASWALMSTHVLEASKLLPFVFLAGWLVGSVNVANFMDGINGISGAHGVIIGATYWILLGETASFWPILAAGLVGASAAFLPWNWGKRARAFLGDGGSYLLGAGFGVLAFGVWQTGYGVLAAIAPVSIYWIDVMSTLVYRIWRRERPTSAHRDHVYQRLIRAGYPHPSVAVMVGVFSLLACLVAIAHYFNFVNTGVAWAMLAALWLAYLLLPVILRSREGNMTSGETT